MSEEGDGPAVDICPRWDTGPDGQPMPAGFTVHVAGLPLPAVVTGYEVGAGPAGPMVVLTIPAGQVTVGGKPPVTAPAGRAARTWGAPRTDPRDGLARRLGEAVGR